MSQSPIRRDEFGRPKPIYGDESWNNKDGSISHQLPNGMIWREGPVMDQGICPSSVGFVFANSWPANYPELTEEQREETRKFLEAYKSFQEYFEKNPVVTPDLFGPVAMPNQDYEKRDSAST